MIRWRGFTLVEMLIVLVLAALMVLMSGPYIERYQEQTAERHFLQTFHQRFKEAQLRARRDQQSTKIIFQDNIRSFKFSYGSPVHSDYVELPKHLKRRGAFKNVEVHDDGYVSPITNRFYDEDKHYYLAFTFQLGGGEYRVRKYKG
ncbi:competence type IV pilus minor pilin ComGD [Limosilactobacillus gastricus]|uniref:competence type IV pilus minor pilin ComGD n=1 Tax=Limosilactobacillus gastricus TaxID=227942 RepID=UPI0009DAE4C2|nr:competence type IV pilus minor pilin ComGD [Limosilactobacillus gastricus]